VWEDNNATIFTVRLEGVIVQGNFNSGAAGTWNKLGPYAITLTDGTINVGATGGAANFSGLEIWSTGVPGGGAGRLAMDVQSTTPILSEIDPGMFDLEAYPNPFSEKLKIIFTTREESPYKVLMFDARGVVLRTLKEGNSTVGKPEILDIDSGELPDGVYLVRLVNGHYIRQVRVALVR
jgi:hypothetical protein